MEFSTLIGVSAKPRFLCHCLRVTEQQVRDCVEVQQCDTVRQVTSACGAGGGCMACHRKIRQVIAESTPEAAPAPAMMPMPAFA